MAERQENRELLVTRRSIMSTASSHWRRAVFMGLNDPGGKSICIPTLERSKGGKWEKLGDEVNKLNNNQTSITSICKWENSPRIEFLLYDFLVLQSRYRLNMPSRYEYGPRGRYNYARQARLSMDLEFCSNDHVLPLKRVFHRYCGSAQGPK